MFSGNKNVKYLLYAIDVFTIYARVKSLKDKKVKTVLNAFIEILDESDLKPNKLWVDQRREFCNNFMQEWVDNNDILTYSTQNEGKSVIAERFIKPLKVKIYKRLTANDSKSYLPYLHELVDQYNNTDHHSINKKPINVDYFAFTEKIEYNTIILIIILLTKNLLMLIILLSLKKLKQIIKLLNLKFMIESELPSIRIFLVKVTLKIGREKYLILFWKLILGDIKIKI